MFQRLSNLLFGDVEEVAAEINGPNPCVTEADEEGWMIVNLPEGATTEASPMEDLLIEHPSMSVYVSQNSTGIVSSSNLPVVREDSTASLVGSMSRVMESAFPATCTTLPTRVSRGAATQAGALAKVTQMARVQRSKARIERRRLGRNHIQRQNRTREQVPRHAAHVRNGFLHQPCKRNLCH
ncbi:tumor protein p53-inducible nuclear protein 2 isoform X3 [Eucyclogobius newberryi]|uniref:tumor protein p53-inducible nuclear protein 2 isoform X3 n=1 Tax=Eucyclogobius newberryi TaxID=166745 RepID=UPI003B597490